MDKALIGSVREDADQLEPEWHFYFRGAQVRRSGLLNHGRGIQLPCTPLLLTTLAILKPR